MAMKVYFSTAPETELPHQMQFSVPTVTPLFSGGGITPSDGVQSVYSKLHRQGGETMDISDFFLSKEKDVKCISWNFKTTGDYRRSNLQEVSGQRAAVFSLLF